MTDNAQAQAQTQKDTQVSEQNQNDTPTPSADPMTTTTASPSASPSSPPAAVPPSPKVPDSSTPSSQPQPQPEPEPKTKARGTKSNSKAKARPRRRAAASDDESEPEVDGGGSDSSLTDVSSDEDDEEVDEEEMRVHPGVKGEKEKEGGTKPVFEDVSSTTPAAWADKPPVPNGDAGATAELTFDEFNRGAEAAGRGKGRERGRGRGGAAGQQREFTKEETARYEEAKKKRKEKQKAKRAELKDAKRKERSDAAEQKTEEGKETNATVQKTNGPKEVKGKGKKKPEVVRADSGVTALVASTSALTLDDTATPSIEIAEPIAEHPTAEAESTSKPSTSASASASAAAFPPSGPKGRTNNRDAYTQRLASDPKFTPRVGGFWTHDQRLYDAGPVGEGGYSGLRQMSEYWRGRGGAAPRGGFVVRGRGRGRGGFPAGPFAPGGFAYRQTASDSAQGSEEESTKPAHKQGKKGGTEGESESDEPERMLAMDRIEAELAAKAKSKRSPSIPAESAAVEEVAPGTEESGKAVVDASPRPKAKADDKWGHEAFEAIQTEGPRRGSIRGGIRGRGRGRGGFGAGFAPRGGAAFAGAIRPIDLPTPQSTPGQTHVNIPSFASQPPKPTPAQPSSSSAPAPAPSSSTQAAGAPPAEQQSTHPGAESLLEDSAAGVTIRLPGQEKIVEVAVPPSAAVEDKLPTPAEASAKTSAAPVPSAPSALSAPPSANASATLYTSPNPPAASTQKSSLPKTATQPAAPFQPRAQPSQAVPFTNGASAPIFYPSSVPHPQSQPSPYPASESGSISSSGHPAHPGHFSAVLPMGYANANGYTGQPRAFYPNGTMANAPRAYPTHPNQQFYQPSYPQDYPQNHAQRGSFSGPQGGGAPRYYAQPQPPSASGYSDGIESPYSASPNPYAMAQSAPPPHVSQGGQGGRGQGQGQPGYFVPPRSSKVSIRPATQSQTAGQQSQSKPSSTLNASTPAFASLNHRQHPQQQHDYAPQAYYPQHYNPYTQQQQQGQGQNGMEYDGSQGYYPAAPNGVNGMNGMNGAAYAWDGQGQGQGQVGYGYEGEYRY